MTMVYMYACAAASISLRDDRCAELALLAFHVDGDAANGRSQIQDLAKRNRISKCKASDLGSGI